MTKTNAARVLDQLNIHYEMRQYAVDPDDLSAAAGSRQNWTASKRTFKTLVARGERHGICFAVIPGNSELDLKALAAAIRG